MTPPSPRRASKGDRTKERILAAALDLFSEQGFATTSVRDIAARADITHVGLMHHFPSKDDMLVRILEYRERQDEQQLASFAQFGIDRLFAWVVEIIQINTAHPERVQLFVKLSAEATTDEHPAREYFTRRYDRVVNAFETAFDEHFVTAPPTAQISPREAAENIVALMDGLQIQWLLSNGRFDMVGHIRIHLRSLGIEVPTRTTPPRSTP